MSKILVTGGTGYIGSHTVVELINEGFEVVIADNLSNSKSGSLDGIEKITGVRPAFEQIDLCDKSKTEALLKKYPDIEAIIHFAAYKAVGESVSQPLKYYHNNLGSLINLLELMQQYSIPNMVFSSSCTVYGQPEKLPVTEDAPVQPATSPYGNTKQISEGIIRDTVAASANINCIALRYFNPVGAHPSALIGELPVGVPNNLVPFITQTAIGIREQLSVFGNDYNTPDGSCIRDYIHVVDLAKAHVVAVRRLVENRNRAKFEMFNLGTGRGVSVLELVHAFEKATGVKLNYKIVGRRSGDTEQVWADTAYANKELGWKAQSTLEETLKSAWDWEVYYKESGGWK
ncbi:MAG: UDP-glucose 4-epimerase GalE [Bacteroidales bacterium]|nr:UDP-glucose 4-epimerase GalE [Bacteroidales bacterium]